MNKIVLISGGFDPLHSGHIAYFKAAKLLGDYLIVAVNSDEWLSRKKGKPFMSFNERTLIIKELACVNEVIGFDDQDNSACAAIMQVLSTKLQNCKLVFANGGDRTNITTPEYNVYGDYPDIEFAFGVGGEDKKNSSSWILKEWKQPTTTRDWGTYTVLDKNVGWQVKELAFYPHQSLSDQRHSHRTEHWHVVQGSILMELEYADKRQTSKIYNTGESIDIPVNTWHRASNVGTNIAKVIEVWLGDVLTENDIERRTQ